MKEEKGVRLLTQIRNIMAALGLLCKDVIQNTKCLFWFQATGGGQMASGMQSLKYFK